MSSDGQQFLESVEAAMRSRGIATEVARAVLIDVSLEWGGQQVYILLRSPYIAHAVMADFNGSNAGELATKDRISRAQVCRGLGVPAAPIVGNVLEAQSVPTLALQEGGSHE